MRKRKSVKPVLIHFILPVFLVAVFALLEISALKASRTSEETRSLAATKTVIIDPGHGGEDGGAIGCDGVIEKDVNLSISLKLKAFFQSAGFHVIMIRDTDRAIYDPGSRTLREKKASDLHNRLKIINSHPNAILISIHQNIYTSSRYSGTQVFYSGKNEKSKILAQTIQDTVRAGLQPYNERQIKTAGKNLFILYYAQTPAVMVECGFLSNPSECKRLEDYKYQGNMAFSIFGAALKYYDEI